MSPGRSPGGVGVPRESWILLLISCAWVLAGLVGHDPWKPDEAYGFGVTFDMMRSGDVVVPTLAGEPFVEKPPLAFATAALSARAFDGVLPPHDGARLATGLWLAAALVFTGLAARELSRTIPGSSAAWPAVLLLAGCPGLTYRGHQLIADVPLLAGSAAALFGLALGLRRPVLGGMWLGMGVGVAFLAKGLLGPCSLALIALALPLVAPAWRTRGHVATLTVAAAVALPFLAIWPAALWSRSPELFREWLVDNNLGRFTRGAAARPLGPDSTDRLFYAECLPWFAFPALPLALWGAVRPADRAVPHPRRSPAIALPSIAAVVFLAVLTAAATSRNLYLLPMLPALAVLGGLSARRLGERAERIATDAVVASTACVAAAAWLAALACATGRPQWVLDLLERGGVTPTPFGPLACVLAVAGTGLWAWLVLVRRRVATPLVTLWAGGVALVWLMAMTVLLPSLDAGNSYRSMVVSLVARLPAGHGEIASQGLGEGQRAMLEYVGGLATRRVEVTGGVAPQTTHLLVQERRWLPTPPADAWRPIWEGARPHDRERFVLYERTGGPR